MHFVAAPVFAMMVLAGCSLIPAYSQPGSTVPERLDGVSAPTVHQESCDQSLSSEDRNFVQAVAHSDAQVEALVLSALCRSPDYRLAELNVRLSRAQSGLSSSARLPQIDGEIVKIKQRFGDPVVDERYRQDLSSATVGLSELDFDFFGRLRSMAAADGLRLDASKHGMDAARGALIAEVLRTYVLYSAANETQNQTEIIQESALEQLTLALRQHALGAISQDDLRQSEAQATQAQANALRAKESFNAQSRALQYLAGFNVKLPSPALSSFIESASDNRQFSGVESSVLLTRPEVLQAEAELRASHADIGAARAAFFPSIQLTTSLGSASEDLGGLFTASRAWTFSPRVTLPIFSFGRNRRALDLAWIRQQQAVVRYEKAIQRAFSDVSDALGSRAHSEEAYKGARQTEIASNLILSAVSRRISAGLQDRSDGPGVRINAANASAERVTASQNLAMSRIALSHAFYGTTAIHQHTPNPK